MSYEIIYDKQFLKANDNGQEVFFPILYWGSNNCIQFDRSNRGRRERSWSTLKYVVGGNHYGTKEQILDYVHKIREENVKSYENYDDKNFGSFASLASSKARAFTFSMFKNIFVDGCRKALTVEELRKFHIFVEISTYIYDETVRGKYLNSGKKEYKDFVSTSEELIEKLKELENHIGEFKNSVSVHVTIDASENQMKWLRKELFPRTKRKKQSIIVDSFFVVRDKQTGNYVLKSTRGGYKFSHYGKAHCKRFVKETEAKKYANKLAEKYFGDRFEVIEVNEQTTLIAYA